MSNRERPPGQNESPAPMGVGNGAELFGNHSETKDSATSESDQAPEYWDWERDRADIIVPTQMAIAAYRAPKGMIAIRQEHDEFEEQDSVVLVHPEHVPALIERLQRLARDE